MFLFQSRRLRLLSTLTAGLFLILVVWRSVFFLHFYGFDSDYESQQLAKAFYLGIKFDVRLALLVMMPLYLLALVPKDFLLNSLRAQLFCRVYLSLASVALLFFYIVDFCYFAYLGERLDSSILRFADTPHISLQMVWESYPVAWLTLLTAAVFFIVWKVLRKMLIVTDRPKIVTHKLSQAFGVAIAMVLITLGLVGRLDGIRADSIVTLRWGEAFFTNNQAVAALALNPVLFFFETLTNQGHAYDENIVSSSYPMIMQKIGGQQPYPTGKLSYRRDVPGSQSGDYVLQTSQQQKSQQQDLQPPNIVLIMLESLGANRLGAFGNPLDPTPHMDALIKQSHFFPNFFVPSSGTARTVFGKITGIPDVSFGDTTASRNPLFMDQQIVVNTLADYEKYYFLGGSANWANIRAVLKNNISGLHLYEEGSWKGPNVDVWGISDRTLLSESHEILMQRDKNKPFFAVIQTAANHRPFTIPDDNSGFQIKDIADDIVQRHGFLGADQYNAIRLLDFNIGYYLNELVAHSDYGNNTLFLLYGDHNDRSNPSPHLKQDDALVLNKHHVPFFIYGPGVLKENRVIETPMSLLDMLPTVVWLAGVPYINTTLGRVIYQMDADDSYVLIHGGDRRNRPTIGLRGNNFYLQMLYDGENVTLHDLHRDEVTSDVQKQFPERTAEMKSLLMGLFHTATYMMYNNHKLSEDKHKLDE